MRAVVFHEPGEPAIETVDDPELEAPSDTLIRITSSGLCGTDLLSEGRTVNRTGW